MRCTLLCWLILLAFSSSCGPAGGGRGSGGQTSSDLGFNPGDAAAAPDASPPAECTPGQKQCEGNSKKLCQLSAQWSVPEPCPAGQVCSGGICGGCAPDQELCQGNTLIKCSGGGGYEVIETCAEKEFCYNLVCLPCIPGAKECRYSDEGVWETWACEQQGQTAEWAKTATCPEDCKQGLCINPCQSDIKLNTNQGCDYYAVDLQNSTEIGMSGTITPANAQFAVIVSNPSAEQKLTVTVHETQKAPAMITEVLQPKTLKIIKLGPRNIFGSIQGELAWRIKGDRPFVAYQFNPLDNQNPVFSNDASLLLPVNALGHEYLLMTGSGGGAYVTIVGTKSETEVTVTVTNDTELGPEVPALAKGESLTRTIGAGEVLSLKATQVAGVLDNLTGTHVMANKNVVVFGGNVAANTADRCCADHLEQQMFPLSSWGTTFVATKSKPRWAENDHWRILAAEDDTKVTFSGGASNPIILDRGGYFDLESLMDFVITADKPIAVGQFLASSAEILPTGVYCDTNADCTSGACAGGGGSGFGMCLDTCNGSSSNCATSEFCIDNLLFGDMSPGTGGSCVNRACGGPQPACPGGSICVQFADGNQQCLAACSGFGGQCVNGLKDCINTTEYGNLCDSKQCLGNFSCSGGWCYLPAGAIDGGCFKSCNVETTCPKSGQICLPAGLGNDPNQTKGICLEPGCQTAADCNPGHACVFVDGQPEGSCQPIGDPAFILAVPVEQFRAEYKFLAPDAYKEDYVNIIAPKTAFVQLDGADVSPQSFDTIGNTDYMVARIELSDGVHSLTASEPVAIVVYGYHDDVSYGYPGGANLYDLGQ